MGAGLEYCNFLLLVFTPHMDVITFNAMMKQQFRIPKERRKYPSIYLDQSHCSINPAPESAINRIAPDFYATAMI